MADRIKLLVHLRRLSGLLESAFRNGPDGTLEGKFAAEHPVFVHHGNAFYLAGCMAFLEGEDGSFSWSSPSASYPDFDSFVACYPAPPQASFSARGISKAAMDALACIRNAAVHHDGDLAKNRNQQSVAIVSEANLPGVSLVGTVVHLEAQFLSFVRLATLAVRNYRGEF